MIMHFILMILLIESKQTPRCFFFSPTVKVFQHLMKIHILQPGRERPDTEPPEDLFISQWPSPCCLHQFCPIHCHSCLTQRLIMELAAERCCEYLSLLGENCPFVAQRLGAKSLSARRRFPLLHTKVCQSNNRRLVHSGDTVDIFTPFPQVTGRGEISPEHSPRSSCNCVALRIAISNQ